MHWRRVIVALVLSGLVVAPLAAAGTGTSQQDAPVTNATLDDRQFVAVDDERTIEVPGKYQRHTDVPLHHRWAASPDPRAALSVMAAVPRDGEKGYDNYLLVVNASSGDLETYPGRDFPKHSRTSYADGKILGPLLIPYAFDLSNRTYDEYGEKVARPPILGLEVRQVEATPTFYVQATGANLVVAVRHDQYSPETIVDRPVMNDSAATVSSPRSAWPVHTPEPWAVFNERIGDRKVDGRWGTARIATSGETVYYLHDPGQGGYQEYLMAYNLSTAEVEWSVTDPKRAFHDLAARGGWLYALDVRHWRMRVYGGDGTLSDSTRIMGSEFEDAGPDWGPNDGAFEHVGDRFVVVGTTGVNVGPNDNYASAGVAVYDRMLGRITVGDQVGFRQKDDTRPPTDPVAFEDGRVYFTASDEVRVYNASSGQRLATLDSGGSAYDQPGAIAVTNGTVSVALEDRVRQFTLADYAVDATPVDGGRAIEVSVTRDGTPVTDGNVSVGDATASLDADGTATFRTTDYLGTSPESGEHTRAVTVNADGHTFETNVTVFVADQQQNEGDGSETTATGQPLLPDLGGGLGVLALALGAWWRMAR